MKDNLNKKTKIAYLAPEIPALSATFVYNEILCLEKKGYEVVPISVHVPKSVAEGVEIADLKKRTIYLYKLSKWSLVLNNVAAFIKSPIRYCKVLFMAISDSLKVGITTRTGMGLIYRSLMASSVASILRKNKCQHLHVHFAHIPTDIAMYASRLTGTPFSFTSHANDLFERGWLLNEKVARSEFAVTISEFNKKSLINIGASREKVHVIHCGVNPDSFAASISKPRSGVFKIGSLGRMVEKKGFDTLIRACRKLKDNGISFKLEIVGDGPLEKELHNMVETLNLSKEIIFPGALPHHKVSEWLKRQDLFVLACKKDRNGDMDGIPVVLMEAMLIGVPVVSTRISGIPELVENWNTGYLVRPDDPDGLALTIRLLLTNEGPGAGIRQDAVRKIRSEFDLSKNVEKLMALFMESAL